MAMYPANVDPTTNAGQPAFYCKVVYTSYTRKWFYYKSVQKFCFPYPAGIETKDTKMILDETTELPLRAEQLCIVESLLKGKGQVRKYGPFGGSQPNETVSAAIQPGVYLLPEIEAWLDENCPGKWSLKAPQGKAALADTNLEMLDDLFARAKTAAKTISNTEVTAHYTDYYTQVSKIIFHDIKDAVLFKCRWH